MLMVNKNKQGKGVAYVREGGDTGEDKLDVGVKYDYEFRNFDLYVNGYYIAGAYNGFWVKTQNEEVSEGLEQRGRIFTTDFKVNWYSRSDWDAGLEAEMTHFSAFIKYKQIDTFKVDNINEEQMKRIERAWEKNEPIKLSIQRIWKKEGNKSLLRYEIVE